MALTAAQDKEEEEEEEGGGGGDTEKEEYFPGVFDFFLLRYSGSFVGTTPPGRSMRFRPILRRLLGLIWLRRRMVGRPGGKGGKTGNISGCRKESLFVECPSLGDIQIIIRWRESDQINI